MFAKSQVKEKITGARSPSNGIQPLCLKTPIKVPPMHQYFKLCLRQILSNSLNKLDLGLTFWILYFLILINSSIFFRVIVRDILFKIEENSNIKKDEVVIYGDTNKCIQLVNLLKTSQSYEILSIIEENEIHELFDKFESTLDKGVEAVK